MPPADDAVLLRRARAQAQLLRPADAGGGTPSVVTVVRRLLAVQAQDAAAARLALRARIAGLRPAQVDEAPLVVSWLCRGTLHLVTADDWGWLLALTAPGRRAANRRRLAQEGVDDGGVVRGLDAMERALGERGPLTRAELAGVVAGEGVRVEGQALPHLLMRAALDGRVVGGLDGRWRRTDPPAGEDRDELLARLARRYLAAHAPAEPEDLARWAGIPVGEARRGFAATDPALAAACLLPPPPAPLPPRLLPPFDPYVLGWRDRTFAVPEAVAARVHPGGGMLRATVCDDGVAVGTWTAPGRRVRIAWFGAPVDVAGEVADVERFLGD